MSIFLSLRLGGLPTGDGAIAGIALADSRLSRRVGRWADDENLIQHS